MHTMIPIQALVAIALLTAPVVASAQAIPVRIGDTLNLTATLTYEHVAKQRAPQPIQIAFGGSGATRVGFPNPASPSGFASGDNQTLQAGVTTATATAKILGDGPNGAKVGDTLSVFVIARQPTQATGQVPTAPPSKWVQLSVLPTDGDTAPQVHEIDMTVGIGAE